MSKQVRFVWREILSTDAKSTEAFFTKLFEWTVSEMDMGPEGKYRMFSAPGLPFPQGGFVQIDPVKMAGIPSHTLGSISIDDVSAAMARVERNGGSTVVPTTTMPDGSQYAVACDPQGAVFGFYHSDKPSDRAVERPKIGEWCWDQLNCADAKASMAFYGEVAGWKITEHDGMALFTVGTRPEDSIASIVPAPAGVRSHWLSHIVVENLAATRTQAIALGGKVLVKEIAVPGLGAFAVLQDPAGVTFCTWEEAKK